MSLYSTPLQFGYFLAIIMAIMFWYRGFREERLSDTLLGWIMLLLAIQMQDYTFGFSGINFLWEEMNGFPRSVALLFGPAIYFYLRAQVNRNFKLRRIHFLHLLPWFFFFSIHLIFFIQGEYVVQWWQSSVQFSYLGYLMNLSLWTSYFYYFYGSLKLYKKYRAWAMHQFSDQEIVSFRWFRNFIYLMIFGVLFMQIMFFLDGIFDWDFYQDWWWNLGMVVITFYVGIQGYAQYQPVHMSFLDDQTSPVIEEGAVKEDLQKWKTKIEYLMQNQKPYLESSMNLRELANLLKTNSSTLSAAINYNFGKNFNDFINGYRVDEFVKRINEPHSQEFTILAIALDCGFNSKATFNRAFRKATGKSPNELRRV